MTTHSLIIFYRKMSESGEISHESIALSQYDILRRIFRSLPMKEVRRLASVCKIWNEVSFRLGNQAHDWCCQYPLLFCPQSVVMILAPRYASERGIHWRINREIDKSVYTKHPINMCEKNPISGKLDKIMLHLLRDSWYAILQQKLIHLHWYGIFSELGDKIND